MYDCSGKIHPKTICNIYPLPFMPACVVMAHAYVPYQSLVRTYPLKEAMVKGTLFPELYQPYIEKDKTGGILK